MSSAPDALQRRLLTKAPKLRPDQVDRLRDFKFDYQARHRVEADEGDVLQRFFDDDFDGWVARILKDSPMPAVAEVRAKHQKKGKEDER